MSGHNETHAEAVAALRRWGKCHFARSAKVREFCDRIQAAHKREMSKIVSKNRVDFGQLGDAARLREAVETALTTIRGVINRTIAPTNNSVFDCRDKLKAALAAPPRNCDLYNDVEDSWQDYKQFRRQIGEAIYFDMVHFWPFAKWLFAPATEQKGETDGGK